MDQDLLPYLLAAFPPPIPAAAACDGDHLIIRGYRVAADAIDARLMTLLQGNLTDAEARPA